ncbi:hypothetical protein [Miniphocaeibacter massiliensis]|uniref:hypothetical protein n=1 Tax=Miniphocaeibacter massiliensis TaxID=2041841 RepID=UPI000C1C19A7|nr:hypothetical protein [Miniphocaeibacter massiliensis]
MIKLKVNHEGKLTNEIKTSGLQQGEQLFRTIQITTPKFIQGVDISGYDVKLIMRLNGEKYTFDLELQKEKTDSLKYKYDVFPGLTSSVEEFEICVLWVYGGYQYISNILKIKVNKTLLSGEIKDINEYLKDYKFEIENIMNISKIVKEEEGKRKITFDSWTEEFDGFVERDKEYKNNEILRIENEYKRILDENKRIAEENTRVSSEKNRVSNFDTWTTKFNEFVEKNKGYENNETQRVANENYRVSAENTRLGSEENRISNFKSWALQFQDFITNDANHTYNESRRIEKMKEIITIWEEIKSELSGGDLGDIVLELSKIKNTISNHVKTMAVNNIDNTIEVFLEKDTATPTFKLNLPKGFSGSYNDLIDKPVSSIYEGPNSTMHRFGNLVNLTVRSGTDIATLRTYVFPIIYRPSINKYASVSYHNTTTSIAIYNFEITTAGKINVDFTTIENTGVQTNRTTGQIWKNLSVTYSI